VWTFKGSTQKLKMCTFKGSFERYWSRALAKPGWNYEQRFAALFASGMNFRVLPLSRKLITEGLCRQFLLALGMPEGVLDDLVEPAPSNMSPGPRAIAAIRAVNEERNRRGIRANRRKAEKAASIVRRTHDLIGHDDGRFNALTEMSLRSSGLSIANRTSGSRRRRSPAPGASLRGGDGECSLAQHLRSRQCIPRNASGV
jgi:hypothetical protein